MSQCNRAARQLTQRVSVTVKRADAAALFPVMEQLRTAVAHIPDLALTHLNL